MSINKRLTRIANKLRRLEAKRARRPRAMIVPKGYVFDPGVGGIVRQKPSRRGWRAK